MFSDLRYRLRALFRRSSLEAELDQEVRAHIEQQAEKYIQSGMSPEEASRRSRVEFGGVEQVKEECREAWGVRFISELAQDLRYGLRQLRRNPGFTAVAILTLALGIGANTATFSVANGILLKSLPYPQPERLYVINEVVPQMSRFVPYWPVNGGNFLLWRSACPAFSAMAALHQVDYNLIGTDLPRQIHGALVSAGFFSMMGVQPQTGRTFVPEEDQPGHGQEVILTHSLWQNVFSSDPGVIGKSITLNDAAYTVIGLLPANFRFPEVQGATPEFFVPLILTGKGAQGQKAGIGYFTLCVPTSG